MENKQFGNQELLATTAKIEQLLTEIENEIEERHLYNDAAKLATMKAKFAGMHLKLQEYQAINQPSSTSNREM